MSSPMLRRHALAAAITLFATLTLTAPAVQAQEDGNASKAAAPTGGAAGASERARQKREQKQKKVEAVPALYPAATRKEPAAQSSAKGGKHLQTMIKHLDAKNAAGVETELQVIVADGASNAYDKSFAYQIAANAAADASQQDKAIEYFQKALDSGGLDNNGHYQVMYNLAVVQYQAGKHDASLTTLQRFLTETKSENVEHLGLKAGLLSDLKRPAEAVAIYEGLLAKSPTDKKLLMNAVALFQQAGQDAKANALLKDAFDKGMLTTANEYRAVYVGYIADGKIDEALKIIDSGIAKGTVTPSPELARDYAYLAQTAYTQNKVPLAIDLFKRAAPMAADGEVWLNLARVYSNEKRISEAKTAAQAALAKGVKKPDDAKRIIALPGK